MARDAGAWLRERGARALDHHRHLGDRSRWSSTCSRPATSRRAATRTSSCSGRWRKNFAGGDGMTWRGVDLNMRSTLYPMLLAPAFWFAKTVPRPVHRRAPDQLDDDGRDDLPGLSCWRGSSSTAGGAGRRADRVAVPAMNYAGIIGTENLGYFTFTAACGAMLLALARPRTRNTALAFALIVRRDARRAPSSSCCCRSSLARCCWRR